MLEFRLFKQQVWGCPNCPGFLRARIEGLTELYYCRMADTENPHEYPKQIVDPFNQKTFPDFCPLPEVEKEEEV